MSESILVTGGGGYLGSVLVPELLASGYRVTVLDTFEAHDGGLLGCAGHPRFQVVRGDCRDERVLSTLVPQHDTVLPLAAVVGAPACDADRAGAVSTNLDAITTLCDLLSPEQRVLYPTTNSGYGIGDAEALCTEESPLRPVSLYGETKMEAESHILQRARSISFRFATVFGVSPRMRTDLLVNDFVLRAARDRAIVLFEGHFRRNFLHVRDVARVFLHGLQHFDAMAGRAYNAGHDDANLTKRELCERIGAHVEGLHIFDAAVARDQDQRNYLVSNARLYATGFTPVWSLDDGIRELLVAYRMLQVRALGNA
jgi:nucleoside-diphosphate-sugar epimerase